MEKNRGRFSRVEKKSFDIGERENTLPYCCDRKEKYRELQHQGEKKREIW
jgi:hypothetical protein